MQPWAQLGSSHETSDANRVGGKGAGLDFLLRNGYPCPPAVAITTSAFARFVADADILPLIERLDHAPDNARKHEMLPQIRQRILSHPIPEWLRNAIDDAIKALHTGTAEQFCVRSSATVEDSEHTSFAGVFESFIGIRFEHLAQRLKECYACMYSEHAFEYAQQNGISLSTVQMAVIIQPLVSAKASGVAFTCESETGCDKNVVIQSAFGLGEAIVSGELSPDTYIINKWTGSIIKKSIPRKPFRYITGDARSNQIGMVREDNEPNIACSQSLSDKQALHLFQSIIRLHSDYGRHADIEWVLKEDGQFALVQVRPLTNSSTSQSFITYTLPRELNEPPIITGHPITDRIVVGRVRHAPDKDTVAEAGDVIVAKHIDVDWTPNLKNASAVITEGGGYTSHVAIILREMGIPALFGAEDAYQALPDGAVVTVACHDRPGAVWLGELPYSTTTYDIGSVYRPRTRVHLVSSSIVGIDKLLNLPLSGIGLVRLEFLISEAIGIHPMAIADYVAGKPLPKHVAEHIRSKSKNHQSADEFYVATLTERICAFASRCPGKVVNVRFADLLTDDYLTLVGGDIYEIYKEANPMLGWRGTTRLTDEEYREAFILDCRAFRRAIDELGFSNINMLLPFCRMPEDVKAAVDLIRTYGPSKARIGMMVEVPSNVALAKEFAELADFFLVGPMDMTQLTYGADRKAKKLARYNNQTLATKEMVKLFLQRTEGCRKEVFIGGWPLFQYLQEYLQVATNNTLHLVELPDRLIELFENLERLEGSLFPEQGGMRQDTPSLILYS